MHFGAVDWQTDVYVNGVWVGSHEGGYDGFSFPITDALDANTIDSQEADIFFNEENSSSSTRSTQNTSEIVVVVHDPSNYGPQPFGKQRVSAMWSPAGDTYWC